jgi:NADP-reducing hydrogenase subunit HndA
MKKKIFSTLLLVAFALASTSMFVSCKDYDYDINKNAADISALRAELEQKLADCKTRCDAEHAKFLTAQDLAGYAKLSDIPTDHVTLSALQAELANYVKASEIQDALDYIKALQEKGITADGLAELGVKVAAIDEALLKLLGVDSIDKAAAAAENLKAQIDALNLYGEALKKENIDPDKLVELLKINEGECTPDGKFSLDACRCVGACGLAPVMMINDDVYGRLTPEQIEGILAKY